MAHATPSAQAVYSRDDGGDKLTPELSPVVACSLALAATGVVLEATGLTCGFAYCPCNLFTDGLAFAGL